MGPASEGTHSQLGDFTCMQCALWSEIGRLIPLEVFAPSVELAENSYVM